MREPFGKELILDMFNCSNITERSLQLFLQELHKVTKMKPYGRCLIKMFGEGRFRGFSLFQFITTSSVTGHFTSKDAYLNLFSCKDFDAQEVVEFAKNWFTPETINVKVLRR